MFSKGDLDEAEHLRPALSARERVLGLDHPETLKNLSRLAEVLETRDRGRARLLACGAYPPQPWQESVFVKQHWHICPIFNPHRSRRGPSLGLPHVELTNPPKPLNWQRRGDRVGLLLINAPGTADAIPLRPSPGRAYRDQPVTRSAGKLPLIAWKHGGLA